MSKRNLALDGLRGYAALAVVIFHSILYFDPSLIDRVLSKPLFQIAGTYDVLTKIVLAIFNGETAVIIFFILSGAVLFESLNNARQEKFIPTIVNFSVKRIVRIYPALIFCLLLFFAVFKILNALWPDVYQTFSNQELLENALLYSTKMHGASWTLQIEILAVPFILIGFFAYRLMGIAGLFLFLMFTFVARHYPALVFHFSNLNDYLFYFALGLLIPTSFARRLFSFFRENNWIVLLVLLLFIRQVVRHKLVWAAILQGGFAFLLIGNIYYYRSRRLTGFLATKVSAYLGKISYSFYLLNVIFLNMICALFKLHPLAATHYLEFGLVAGLLVTLVTIPFAHFSEKYIERFSIKAGRTLGSFKKPKPIPT